MSRYYYLCVFTCRNGRISIHERGSQERRRHIRLDLHRKAEPRRPPDLDRRRSGPHHPAAYPIATIAATTCPRSSRNSHTSSRIPSGARGKNGQDGTSNRAKHESACRQHQPGGRSARHNPRSLSPLLLRPGAGTSRSSTLPSGPTRSHHPDRVPESLAGPTRWQHFQNTDRLEDEIRHENRVQTVLHRRIHHQTVHRRMPVRYGIFCEPAPAVLIPNIFVKMLRQPAEKVQGKKPARLDRGDRTLVDDGFPGLFPGLVAWISNVISSLPDRDEPLAMPRSMIACWGCRLAGSASSRFAAPPLRCGPSGDPLPSIRRGAAMAVRQAFGHWPNPRREGVERRRCRWWRGRCGAVVPVPFNA